MEGYFFCADLLGFSEIVKNLGSNEADLKIDCWVSLVEKLTTKYEIKKYQLLSDTLFIGLENNSDDLNKIIDFSRDLLNNGIQQSLIIRGAITRGEYTWGKLVYGPAVINAHALEKNQNWIGILVDNTILLDEIENKQNVICYPIPMQSSHQIKLYITVAWTVPSFEELSILTTKDGLGGVPGKGKILNWDWANKVSNTVMFGLYMRAIAKSGKDNTKFSGLHPIHFIDLTFRNSVLIDE